MYIICVLIFIQSNALWYTIAECEKWMLQAYASARVKPCWPGTSLYLYKISEHIVYMSSFRHEETAARTDIMKEEQLLRLWHIKNRISAPAGKLTNKQKTVRDYVALAHMTLVLGLFWHLATNKTSCKSKGFQLLMTL